MAANNPTTISMAGWQVEMKQTRTIAYIYKVLNVRDGDYLMKISIDRVQTTSSTTGEAMNMGVDTDSDDRSEMTSQLHKMVNQEVTQWMDTKLKPLSELENEAVDGLVEKGVTTMVIAPAFFPAGLITQGESLTTNSPLFSGEDANTRYEGVVALVTVSDADCIFRANGKTIANFEGLIVEGNVIDNIVLDHKTGMIKDTFGAVSLRGNGNVQRAQAEISSSTITLICLL